MCMSLLIPKYLFKRSRKVSLKLTVSNHLYEIIYKTKVNKIQDGCHRNSSLENKIMATTVSFTDIEPKLGVVRINCNPSRDHLRLFQVSVIFHNKKRFKLWHENVLIK